MPHTCPHCSAIFDQWHDVCPSCNRSMIKRGWLVTVLMAIFKPKRSHVTTELRRPEMSGGLRIGQSFTFGKPIDVRRSERIVFNDGSGEQEWSNWEEVPPKIRAQIEALGGGPEAERSDLSTRTRRGRIDLDELPAHLRAKLEAMRGEAEVKTVRFSSESKFRSGERSVDGAAIERSSINEGRFRYEDSDGNVHEAERLEDLPEHVQEMFRRMSQFGGE